MTQYNKTKINIYTKEKIISSLKNILTRNIFFLKSILINKINIIKFCNPAAIIIKELLSINNIGLNKVAKKPLGKYIKN